MAARWAGGETGPELGVAGREAICVTKSGEDTARGAKRQLAPLPFAWDSFPREGSLASKPPRLDLEKRVCQFPPCSPLPQRYRIGEVERAVLWGFRIAALGLGSVAW